MLELFQGRLDDFAIQYPDGHYEPARRPLTAVELARHLSGELTIGVYMVRPQDGTCRWGVIDLDEDRRDYLEALWSAAVELRVPANAMLREASGRKGYHLWIFFADWTPAYQVRRLLLAIVASSGVPPSRLNEKGHTLPLVEVYPKQDDTAKLEKRYGNLVKLPLGIHRVSGRMGEPLEVNGAIEPLRADEVLTLLAPLPDDLKVEATEKPITGGRKTRPYPCTEPMMLATWDEGGRNQALFLIGKRLNTAGYSEDEMLDALLPWNESNLVPPLGKAEARRTIRSASNYTGMGCLDPLVIPHCVVTCPIYAREHPATQGPGGPRLQVTTSDPPLYLLPLSVGMLKLTHVEMVDWELVRKATAGQLHVFLPHRKQNDWERELEPLMRNVERVEAPAEVSPDGVVLGLLKQWVGRATDDPAQVERRNVWHDEENAAFVFQGPAFIHYVQQVERTMERTRIWQVVRKVKGSRSTRTINDHLSDVWEVPDDIRR
jgi:hypothetical protein